MAEMQGRIDDYLTFGVKYVWVINPITRRAFVYSPDSVHEIKDAILRASNPEIGLEIIVPVAEIE